jgi:outer membrane receptor protein involved in Fe transport
MALSSTALIALMAAGSAQAQQLPADQSSTEQQAPPQRTTESIAPPTSAASDADAPASDIVVTGTYIRRSQFQQSSPVDVVGREKLETSASTTVADFVKDLPINFGSNFSSGRSFGSEHGGGTINLRGLGASATLVLINSKRQTQVPDASDNVVDVNSLIPEIMIERLEILKDGASALYGSDAVAGVVNFITNDKFEGLKVEARGNQYTYSDKGDRRIEMMVGTKFGESTHITAAFGIYDQDALRGYYSAPSQANTLTDFRYSSPTGSPGEFVVPTRNAAGALTNSPRRNVVDPTCGQIVGSVPTNTVNGVVQAAANPAAATDCRYMFAGDNGPQSGIRRYQAMVRATSDISDHVRFKGEFGYSYVKSETYYTAGDPIGTTTVIPGTNPGNTYYRAVDAQGRPLYAASSGIDAGFQRDGAQVFVPQRDSRGRVVLSANPTDPASGIPFYEDVTFSGRPIGSQGGLPTGNKTPAGAFANSRPSVATNHILRAAGGFDGEFSDKWRWQAGMAWSRYQLETNNVVGGALTNELNYALQGLGGATCNRQAATPTPGRNGCSYYNLFGDSALAAPGSAAANTQDVIDYVIPLLTDSYASSLWTADLVVSGEPFQLPAGAVGLAIGYQHRRSDLTIDYDNASNIGDRASGVIQKDFSASSQNDAFFGELSVPVFQGPLGYFELTGALRHERLSGNLKTTDPKLGFLYKSPGGTFSLRGSYGTSFIAPSLFRRFANTATGLAVSDCPVSQGAPCTGEPNVRVALFQQGNPDLRPETSKAWSFGGTVKPLRGLTIEGTWWKFDFNNKIATQTPDSIVLANPNGTPTNPVVRDANGRIVSVTVRYFNTASVVTEGIDLSANYATSLGKLGDLNLSVAGTYNYKYDFQDTPGGPIIHAAGESNDRRTASPNTKLRINGSATWALDGHRVTVGIRYYGSLNFTLKPGYRIGSWSPVDLAYDYTFKLGSREARIGVGATNLFAQKEPFVPDPAFPSFIPSLYDVRGRIVSLKAGVTF